MMIGQLNTRNINKNIFLISDLSAVNFIIPVADSKGKFVIGSGHSLYIIGWDGLSEKISSIELLHELTDALDNHRINDAKCDASGRLWFGKYSTEIILF